jgi:hypothetical protein
MKAFLTAIDFPQTALTTIFLDPEKGKEHFRSANARGDPSLFDWAALE